MLIQEYQNRWETDFKKLKNFIEKNLSLDDINIEHVGSTSIRGLAAKPIIDIDVVYGNAASFVKIKVGLEKLGYTHSGDQGIPGREVFKRKNIEDIPTLSDTIKHHLYVCHIQSDELQRHLLFRNFLRKNTLARIEYEKLKYKIADMVNQDKKFYTRLKEDAAREFVERCIQKSKTK